MSWCREFSAPALCHTRNFPSYSGVGVMVLNIHFVIVDRNQGNGLQELWRKIVMEKLCSCWR